MIEIIVNVHIFKCRKQGTLTNAERIQMMLLSTLVIK